MLFNVSITMASLMFILLSPAWVNAAPYQQNEKRTALVIGNSSYDSAPLKNPANDAKDIAAQLEKLGFTVSLHTDISRKEMRRAIRAFGEALKVNRGVGLFYYAGHGMQVKGTNFLIPLQTDIMDENEVVDEAVDANSVLRKMQSASNRLNLVILDACRNNPFKRSFRSSARGLAQMEAPSGSLIIYATAAGSVAADGSGRNGTFTKHLLKQMQEPGLELSQMVKRVRVGVQDDTSKLQVPWDSSSLTGDFYFIPPNPNASANITPPLSTPATAQAKKGMRWGDQWGDV